PSEIAASRSLDLDDARAEIGELTGAERTRNCVLQRDNGNPFQWENSRRLGAASAFGQPGGAHWWTHTLAASVANEAAAMPPEGEHPRLGPAALIRTISAGRGRARRRTTESDWSRW